MFSLVVGTLRAGLTLLAEREKNFPLKTHLKFQERLDKIEKEWQEEYDRPEETQSDAALDVLERELRQLTSDYIAAALQGP